MTDSIWLILSEAKSIEIKSTIFSTVSLLSFLKSNS